MRTLSNEARMGSGHLPMILSGRRELSRDAFLKLAPLLHLKRPELRYLEKLIDFGSTQSLQIKVQALDSMNRSWTYQKRHPEEVQFFEYMSHWVHIVIREMSRLEGFQADAEWIRQRLRWRIPLSQIGEALDFLLRNGFLVKDAQGRVAPAEHKLDCEDEVFSTALKRYHQQMFTMATDCMENTPSEQRELHGYTFAISSNNFEQARKIIEKALHELEGLEKKEREPRDSIYHAQLALFPMTGTGGERP
jgi:uncharacterized protein (TIGR02147 family)